MVLLTVVYVAVIAIMALVVLRRGTDNRVHATTGRRWVLLLAAAPIVLQAAVLLVFGAGEMLGGDPSGAMHLVTLVPPLLLAWLAWRRPIEGGAALIVASLTLPGLLGLDDPTALAIMVLPGFLSGVMFLIAGLAGRNAAASPA